MVCVRVALSERRRPVKTEVAGVAPELFERHPHLELFHTGDEAAVVERGARQTLSGARERVRHDLRAKFALTIAAVMDVVSCSLLTLVLLQVRLGILLSLAGVAICLTTLGATLLFRSLQLLTFNNHASFNNSLPVLLSPSAIFLLTTESILWAFTRTPAWPNMAVAGFLPIVFVLIGVQALWNPTRATHRP